jgi:hypothetical protein
MAESHVATTEWQSFEIRMRKRRAERCLLRADVALEAGFVEDAREALEEARRLDPESSGLASIEQRVAGADAAARALVANRRRRVLTSAAAVAFVVLGGSLVFKRASVEVEPAQATATPNVAADQQPVQPNATQPETIPSVNVETEQIVARAVTPRLLAYEPERAPGESVAAVASEPVEAAAHTETAASTGNEPPNRPAVERPDVPVPAVAAPSPGAPVTALNSFSTARVGELPEPPPPPPPVTPALMRSEAPPDIEPEPPRVVTEESGGDEGVRTVLARYESAYSSLDAIAAGAVYPAIDRQALSRAFEGLAAQRVSLGDCDVRVIGAAAHAECVGNATWTPKIGGGSRTQPRLWQFDLRRTDTGWQITRATARNHQGSNP